MNPYHPASCSEIEPRLAALLFRELDRDARVVIELHLEFCPRCQRELEQMRGALLYLQSNDPAEVPGAFEPVLSHRRFAELLEACAGNPFDIDVTHITDEEIEMFATENPPASHGMLNHASDGLFGMPERHIVGPVSMTFFSIAAMAALVFGMMTSAVRVPEISGSAAADPVPRGGGKLLAQAGSATAGTERANPSAAEAEEIKINPAPPMNSFTVLVCQVPDELTADLWREHLEKRGLPGVKVEMIEGSYCVMVGKYDTEEGAEAALARVAIAGHPRSQIAVLEAGTISDRPGIGELSENDVVRTADFVISTLKPELKLEIEKGVREYVAIILKPSQFAHWECIGPLPESPASGQGGKKTANPLDRLVEMENGLRASGVDIESVDKHMFEFLKEDVRKRRSMALLFRDANNLAKGKKYSEAIAKLRKILKINPDNQLAKDRIRVLENLVGGKVNDDHAGSKSRPQ